MVYGQAAPGLRDSAAPCTPALCWVVCGAYIRPSFDARCHVQILREEVLRLRNGGF